MLGTIAKAAAAKSLIVVFLMCALSMLWARNILVLLLHGVFVLIARPWSIVTPRQY